MDEEEAEIVVIDNGSYTSKAGFAGSAPSKVFPSVVTRPKRQAVPIPIGDRTTYAGHEVESKRGTFHIRYPIKNGIVTSWDDMEKLWHHTFYNELRVAPEEHFVILTEKLFAPKASRESLTQIMFETFNVSSMYLGNQAALAMHATGRTTGLVCDIGANVTTITPIYKGYPLPHAVQILNIAGEDLTAYLIKILSERGYLLTTPSDREIARHIKEEVCYVAQDFEEELAEAANWSRSEKSFKLPDGSSTYIGDECFRCPEVLFQPSLLGTESPGLQHIILRSITICDELIREDLVAHIVLSGGTTMFDGLADRLTKEVAALAPETYNVKVNALPTRQYLVWLGASMLACHPSFKRRWITKEEYDDSGPAIVHRKCL